MRNKEIVSGQQDFGHDIAVVAKILDVIFHTQVVEAIDLELTAVGFFPGVLVDGVVSIFDKLKSDVPCIFHDMAVFRSGDVSHEVHQRCFSTAYGTGQHDPFF